MTTTEVFKDGKCNIPKAIRVKIWRKKYTVAGFSIKCSLVKRTIVVTPFNQDHLNHDLASFCNNCEKRVQIHSCRSCKHQLKDKTLEPCKDCSIDPNRFLQIAKDRWEKKE